MSSSAAIRRLRKEYQLLQASPEVGIVAAPLESNVLEWHFVMHGSADTPYQGGIYHGKLVFPSNFPMKPPSIMMITESGRFAVNRKICMSMSDFHPELWNPLWGVRTILVAMLSFMNSEELTTGGMEATAPQRVEYAQRSLTAIRGDVVVAELFPDIISTTDSHLEYIDNWPPPAREPPPREVTDAADAKPSAVEPSRAGSSKEPEKDEAAAALEAAARKSRTAKSNARKRAKAKAAKLEAGGIVASEEGAAGTNVE